MGNQIFFEIPLEGYQNYRISKKGEILNIATGNKLTPFPDKNGYQIVNVYLTDIGQKTVKLHRLVGFTFVHNPDPENKTQINHKDGIKDNNLYTNLEWVTNKENAQHAAATGLYAVGERSNFSKLTESAVRNIKKALKNNITPLQLAADYGVTRNAIYCIKNNHNWQHVKI